jgi:hypothetical protein
LLGNFIILHLPATTILFLGRLPIIALSLALGWYIFRTSRRWFGDWGGVLSLTLYAFDPGFIAHGHLVTTDLGFSLFAFIAVDRLVTLLERPSRRSAILFFIALWLAGLSKFAILPFLVVLLLVLVLLRLHNTRHSLLQFKSLARRLLVLIPIVFVITWAYYGFDIRRRADDPRVKQLYEQRVDFLAQRDLSSQPPIVRFVMTHVGDTSTPLGGWIDSTKYWPIPGYAIFRGAIAVIGHSIGGQEAYLHGNFRDTGWWWYFPAAIFVKTPPMTLAAFLSVIIVSGWWIMKRPRDTSVLKRYRQAPIYWIVFVAVPILYLGLSMGSHLNLGWRHIMPIYPFLFVLSGVFASPSFLRRWRFAVIIPCLLTIGALASLVRTFPNTLGYFNMFAGGSANGAAWLLDSNLDWGQDLPKLATYMRRNSIDSLPFAYYGWADVPTFVKTTELQTSTDVAKGNIPHGTIAISIGRLYSRNGEFSWLRDIQPVERIGSSILIYRLP